MLVWQNESIQFDIDRCTQCGTCLAACPFNALSAAVDHQDGLWTIRWDEQSCRRCFLCISVCCASFLPKNRLSEGWFDQLPDVRLGNAKDDHVRKSSSSGGVARTLLLGALKRGFVDAVYTLRQTSEYPWAEGSFFYGDADVSNIPRSIYHPVLVNRNLSHDTKANRLLLIGTPCQLLSAKHLLKNRGKQITTVAIFCKQQKTLLATRYLASRMRTEFRTEMQTPVSYRGDGWPGKVTIGSSSMEYEKAAALPFGRRLWRVPGCRFCSDPLGSSVDITLSDPWGIETVDGLGKTLIMVWTKRGKDLLEECKDLIAGGKIASSLAVRSFGLKDISRKELLVAYYLGENVPFLVRLSGMVERAQIAILETALQRIRLPEIGYKVLAHLPDLPGFFIR